MTYVDELESDFSVYHRVDDFYARPMDWIMRLAPKLPVYGGALAVAMTRDERGASLDPRSPQWSVPATAPDEVSDDIVATMWAQHVMADYRNRGFDVTGIEPISDIEMEGMVCSNGG